MNTQSSSASVFRAATILIALSRLPIAGKELRIIAIPGAISAQFEGISDNGLWAVGTATFTGNVRKGFRANRDGTTKVFTLPANLTPDRLRSITDDGNFAVGYGSLTNGTERAFIWTNAEPGTGTTSLIPTFSGYDSVSQSYISRDGTSVATTLYNSTTSKVQAARYLAPSSFSYYDGNEPLPNYSKIYRIVGQGSTIQALGRRRQATSDPNQPSQPIAYNQLDQNGYFLDTRNGIALDRSENNVYVGSAASVTGTLIPTRWVFNPITFTTTQTSLGSSQGEASYVNADGSRIIGSSGGSAFIWTGGSTIQNLNTALNSNFGLNMQGVYFYSDPIAMSKDGSQIVGTASQGGSNVALWADLRETFVANISMSVRVAFPSTIGKQYEIYRSTDLQTWTSTGVILQGTGAELEKHFALQSEEVFFRISES